MPSPSEPMSWRRKSENGWNVSLSRKTSSRTLSIATPPVVWGTNREGFAAVVMLSTWQPPHPMLLKMACPCWAAALCRRVDRAHEVGELVDIGAAVLDLVLGVVGCVEQHAEARPVEGAAAAFVREV